MSADKSTRTNRRTLLKLFGGASTAAVTGAADITPADAYYDPGERETSARYRETEHVKAFYRTNRYETLKRE